MTYLPTTTLEVNTFLFIPLVICITIVAGLATLAAISHSNRVITGTRDSVTYAGGTTIVVPDAVKLSDINDPAITKRNALLIWMIFAVILTIIPASMIAKNHEAIEDKAALNLRSNLIAKYEVEAVRTQLFDGPTRGRTSILSPRYEGTQYVAVKKDGTFNVYLLTQDKLTHEPFLYPYGSKGNVEPLTSLP